MGPSDWIREVATAEDGRKAIAEIMASPDSMAALVEDYSSDPMEIESALVEVGGIRGLGAPCRTLQGAIKRAAKQAEHQGRLRLADAAEDAPPVQIGDCPPLNIPARYEVTRRGIKEIRPVRGGGEEVVRLTHRPILPRRVLVDIDDNSRSLDLGWPDEGNKWRGQVVRASTTQDSRAFVELRNDGAPVAAHNAAALGRFLDLIEEHNDLPRSWSTSRQGWLRGGELGFALGETVIGGDGQAVVQIEGGGDEMQIAEALRSEGDCDEWLKLVDRVKHLPSPMLAVYASIASCLLEPIPSAPNAILDWNGETSHGKTTILRLAASVWGYPSERAGGIIQKWNSTQTKIERLAAFSCFVPVFLDDTKDVPERQKPMIARVGYQFYDGKGRGRGTITGTQRTVSWRSTLLSTGEAPMTSASQDGGLRARVLSIQGQPLGDGNQERLSDDITEGSALHFGHMGPRVVRYLLDRRKSWPKMAARYTQQLQELEEKCERPATKRLARSVALLIAAKGVAEACGLPAPTCDPIGYAWACAVRGGEDTDRPRVALDEVYSWAVSHAAEFWGRHDRDDGGNPTRRPSKGWAGSWDTGHWSVIVFKPECLESVLRHLNYEPQAVIPLWRERGWMQGNEQGRDTYRVPIEGERVRWLALRREAIGV